MQPASSLPIPLPLLHALLAVLQLLNGKHITTPLHLIFTLCQEFASAIEGFEDRLIAIETNVQKVTQNSASFVIVIVLFQFD
jgi:Mg2+ and Co2+ transporter CorA